MESLQILLSVVPQPEALIGLVLMALMGSIGFYLLEMPRKFKIPEKNLIVIVLSASVGLAFGLPLAAFIQLFDGGYRNLDFASMAHSIFTSSLMLSTGAGFLIIYRVTRGS